MKKALIIIIYALIVIKGVACFAQDTFSIVAVDSITKEVGSAGASCVPILPGFSRGAYVISDLIPGKGALNTQAYYYSVNQDTAHVYLTKLDVAKNIISSTLRADAMENGHDSTYRQYGVALLNNNRKPDAAGFTGTSCLSFKKNNTGKYYSVQGNTLIGNQVIDSIEARFVRAKGSLGDRLMYALEGAKVKGADHRCTPYNTSSLSAFLRVAKPTDATSTNYIDLSFAYSYADTTAMKAGIKGDPIDSLRKLYNKSVLGIVYHQYTPKNNLMSIYPNPITKDVSIDLTRMEYTPELSLQITDLTGKKLYETIVKAGIINDLNFPLAKGIYLLQIRDNQQLLQTGKLVKE